MGTRELAVVRRWMDEGAAAFGRYAAALDEDEMRAPSRLPGWSRAHVVAHMARNAEALLRLVNWARTGVATPMYPSGEVRNEEIEATARHTAEHLKADLSAEEAALAEGVDALTEQQWKNEVRTPQGRPVPATEIPWWRVRELWLHAIDLNTGVVPSDIPAEVVGAMLDDIVAMFDARPGVPAITLHADDRDAGWAIHAGDGDPVAVTGTAADLLGWLTGRAAPDAVTTTDERGVPELPSWL